jgi:hypothetical protein
MPLSFVLDEHLRGPLWTAIQRHNALGENPIDVARVGDSENLPLRTDDTTILVWAERESRLVLTEDKRTLPKHLQNHLKSGGHSPGVLLLRSGHSWAEIVDYLVLVAYAGDPADYRDAVTFIP